MCSFGNLILWLASCLVADEVVLDTKRKNTDEMIFYPDSCKCVRDGVWVLCEYKSGAESQQSGAEMREA